MNNSSTLTRRPQRMLRNMLIGVGALVIFLVAAVVTLALSAVVPIPKPSGPQTVGFRSDMLIDSTRSITRSGATTARSVTLDTWYPAASIDGYIAEPYIDAATAAQLAKYQGIPDLGETASNSFRDAPVKVGSYPVVIFNHGYPSFTRQNFSLCEELASNGFIVIAIGHPGDSMMARDAAGAALPFDAENPIYQRSIAAMSAMPKAIAADLAMQLAAQRGANTLEQHEQAGRALAATPPYSFYEPLLREWALDTRFVIAALTRVPGADPTRVTLMGHSFGGVVSQDLARETLPGVTGLVNLDSPSLRFGADARHLNIPALMLLSTENKLQGHDIGLYGSFDPLLNIQSPGAHVIEIAGTGHFSFSDLSYVRLLKHITPLLGSVDGAQMMRWQNHAVVTFLKRLNAGGDLSAPLLDDDQRIKQSYFAPRR